VLVVTSKEAMILVSEEKEMDDKEGEGKPK
jgi:hypothetical protein